MNDNKDSEKTPYLLARGIERIENDISMKEYQEYLERCLDGCVNHLLDFKYFKKSEK